MPTLASNYSLLSIGPEICCSVAFEGGAEIERERERGRDRESFPSTSPESIDLDDKDKREVGARSRSCWDPEYYHEMEIQGNPTLVTYTTDCE